MSNIIRFKNKRILRGYTDAEQQEFIPESILFFAGLAVSMVLPEAAYCSVGGPVSPTAFTVVALSGLAWGWIKYRRQQPSANSLAALGTLPNAPRAENRPRKAA